MQTKIGEITENVIQTLGLSIQTGTPIYLGQSNIAHMKERHPDDYYRYGAYLPEILSHPDYVGVNPSDHSIEYVKEFLIDREFVKVAVRISGTGNYYARSLYRLNSNRVRNYIAKGTLKKP